MPALLICYSVLSSPPLLSIKIITELLSEYFTEHLGRVYENFTSGKSDWWKGVKVHDSFTPV
jgi:hypothetical protein